MITFSPLISSLVARCRAQRIRKDLMQLEEDMEIAQMDPKDAHARLLEKVRNG
jgi:pyrroloquinoline quinone (PQQ) biosynthesis protein C